MTSNQDSETQTDSLEPLKIPTEYAHYDKLVEESVIIRLEEWKRGTRRVLEEVRRLLLLGASVGGGRDCGGKGDRGGGGDREDRGEGEGGRWELKEEARIIATVVPFERDEPWVTSESRDVARGSVNNIL